MNTQIDNVAMILFQQEDGTQGLRWTRGFLPKKSWPVLVVTSDSVVQITNDAPQAALVLEAQRRIASAKKKLSSPSALEFLSSLDSAYVFWDLSYSTEGVLAPLYEEAQRLTLGKDVRHIGLDGQGGLFLEEEFPSVGAPSDFSLAMNYEVNFYQDAQIVVVTDGFGPHIRPRSPERWTWIITPGGDTWPSTLDVPMDVIYMDS